MRIEVMFVETFSLGMRTMVRTGTKWSSLSDSEIIPLSPLDRMSAKNENEGVMIFYSFFIGHRKNVLSLHPQKYSSNGRI